MKSNILGKIIFAICCSFLISSNNTIENHFTIDVIFQDENSVIINYKINNFDINEVEVEGRTYSAKKILVAGGTGTIGCQLVPKLLARGHDLTVVSLDSETYSKKER